MFLCPEPCAFCTLVSDTYNFIDMRTLLLDFGEYANTPGMGAA